MASSGSLVVVHQVLEQPQVRYQGLPLVHPLFALQDIAPRMQALDLVVALVAIKNASASSGLGPAVDWNTGLTSGVVNGGGPSGARPQLPASITRRRVG